MKRVLVIAILSVVCLACGESGEEMDWDAADYGFEASDPSDVAAPAGLPPVPGDALPGVGDPAAGEEGYEEAFELGYVEELGYAAELGYVAEQGEGYGAQFQAGYAEGFGQQGGYGDQEEGAFRGQAEVGGVPLLSGTVDTSGGGNSVYSVGGKVIELP